MATARHIISDPITFELMRNRLTAAADEMALSLQRSAFSVAAREAMDFSTALCDWRGNVIAQGVGLAIQLGLIPGTMATLIERFRDDWHEGDALVLNDPFLSGAHLSDLLVVKPIFVAGQLVGFACSISHHLDVGGRVPGSVAADNRSLYEEGLVLPPVKLLDRGEWNESVLHILAANVRTPVQDVGDLKAQVAGCRTGERELQALCAEHGTEQVLRFFDELLDYTERLTREEIRDLPDGRYTYTDWLDDDGVGGEPVRIVVTVEIAGDRLTVDFTGSDAARPSAVNSPLNSTRSIAYAAIRSVMAERVPVNSGLYRAVEIVAPPGTVVNAQHPVAVSSRGVTLFRIADAIFGALAQAIPDRVPAGGDGGPTMVIISGGGAHGGTWVLIDLVSGGWGGRRIGDGPQGAPHVGVNHANTPCEVVEAEYPLRVDRYELIPDSEGAGQQRGCLAVERVFTLLGDSATSIVRGDRRRYLPPGLAGGLPGQPSMVRVWRGAGPVEEMPSKFVGRLGAGDALQIITPSGGGWGRPSDRDLALLEQDLADGKISPARAEEVYGLCPSRR